MLNFPGGFRWSDELSTAITFLDDEHRQMIEQYHQVVGDLQSKADLSRFLNDLHILLKDTQAHFVHEEQVMRNIQYPSFSEHEAAHRQLISDFSEFLQNIGIGFSDKDLPALTKYFGYWFITHVKEHDVKLKRYLDRTD